MGGGEGGARRNSDDAAARERWQADQARANGEWRAARPSIRHEDGRRGASALACLVCCASGTVCPQPADTVSPLHAIRRITKAATVVVQES